MTLNNEFYSPTVEPHAKIDLSYYIAQQFYDEVCRRAEANMQKTGRLEGAHYAAMQSVLKEWKERT